jgi:hypothetical protein
MDPGVRESFGITPGTSNLIRHFFFIDEAISLDFSRNGTILPDHFKFYQDVD